MVIAGVMLLAAGRAYVSAQTASGQAPRAIIATKFGNMEIRFSPNPGFTIRRSFTALSPVL
jgi:hypothetical protein